MTAATKPRLTPAEREDYAERAAILEYDAGLSRAEAERRAVALVLAKRGQSGTPAARTAGEPGGVG